MKYATFITILCGSYIVTTAENEALKRFLIANNPAINTNNCDSDILRNFPNDLTLTSSSELYHGDSNHDYSADRGHLDTVETTTSDGVQHMGAWSANFNNMLQHIQIDMKKKFTITGVVTQGRNGCCQEWVTKYRVLYSEDCKTWRVLDSGSATGALFHGNTDENTKVTNMFVSPITVKCIRINPVYFNNHISMRIGLIGSLLQPGGGGTSSCTTTTQRVTPIMTTQTTTVRPVTTTTDVSVSTADSRISSSTSIPSSNANSGDHCQSTPCLNNGICVNYGHDYQCFCPSDPTGKILLSGKRCQIILDTSKISPTGKTLSTKWFKIPGR